MRKVAPTNSTTGDSYFLVVVYYRLCRLNCRRRRRRGIHFAGQIRRPAERERPLWSLDVARCNDAALLYFRFEFQLSPFLSLSLSVFLSFFLFFPPNVFTLPHSNPSSILLTSTPSPKFLIAVSFLSWCKRRMRRYGSLKACSYRIWVLLGSSM